MNTLKTIFISILLSFFLLSCGKVTQEFPKAEKKQSFELSFTVSNIYDLKSKNQPIKGFNITNPIYTVIKGYKINESEQLAYGKLFIEELRMELDYQEQVINKKRPQRQFNSKTFDIKGKEVKEKPLFSQIKGNFNSRSSSVGFKTPNVSKQYESYLIVAYSEKSLYKMKFLDQIDVSKNVKVNVETITDFDTFQSVIRLAAFQNIDYTSRTLAIIKDLFDYQYFTLYPLDLPRNNIEKFSFSKPLFVPDSARLSEFISVLEFIEIDIESVRDYLKNAENVQLTKEEKDYLLSKINSLPVDLLAPKLD